MTLELQLPTAQGGRRSVPVRRLSAGGRVPTGRTADAAVPVVAEPWRTPAGNGRCRNGRCRNGQCHWDTEATLAFRDHVWDQGLGAGAMDTAQRDVGLAQERLEALFRVAGVA